MRSWCSRFLVIVALAVVSFAAPRRHTVAWGRWRVVNASNNEDGRAQQVRVRPMFIDGRLREYVTGRQHDVTDRLVVVRRVRRVNDSLPGEDGKPRWLWQFDTWLSVDRLTGHVAQLNFPAFDPDISQASWYRDYVAYCGPSEAGDKVYMMVVQLGRRKPILKKPFSGVQCAAPVWQRNPSRVIFNLGAEKSSFVVHGYGVSPETEPESGEEGPQ